MEALVDYEKLIAGEFMDEKKIYSRDKKNDLAVEKAVKYLLQPNNIRTFHGVQLPNICPNTRQ